MKYVMFRVPSKTGGPPMMLPVLFPCDIVHSELAAAIRLCSGMEDAEIVAAGAVFLSGPVSTIGRSDSLGVTARKDDAAVILSQL